MAKKRKTNVEFVRYCMDFSQYGALSQAFIIEAIREKAEQVAQTTPDQYPENSFVAPKAWIGVANELKERLAEHYR